MRLATIFLAVSFLSGCASQIMKGFEGKSMVDVVAQYGMPASSYELGGGERAFVWEMSNSVVVPGNMNTTSTLVGNTVFSSSYVAPGYVASSHCSYVLTAVSGGFESGFPYAPVSAKVASDSTSGGACHGECLLDRLA